MESLKNALQYIYDNWSLIVICAGLCIAIYRKVKNWISLSEEAKIKLVKSQLQEIILKYISDAEFEYAEIIQSGSLKRSKVISQIYEDYPIFKKIVDQNKLIKWIDDLIDSALPTLRDMLENNESTDDES